MQYQCFEAALCYLAQIWCGFVTSYCIPMDSFEFAFFLYILMISQCYHVPKNINVFSNPP